MVDDVKVDSAPVTIPCGSGDEEEGDNGVLSDANSQIPDPETESDSRSEELEAEPTPTPLLPKSQKKGPAWVDPDDLSVRISLASDRRLRNGGRIGGRDYK